MTRPLRVLIFSPEPSLEGGVAEFNKLLLRRLSPEVEAETFVTGRRPGVLGTAFRVLIPLVDAFRLAICLATQRHDVYHLNPSFVPRSLLRDGLFLVLLRLFRRRAVLVFFRGWNANYFRRIVSSPLWRPCFRAIYGHTAVTLVLGSKFRNDLIAAGFNPERIHLFTTMFDGTLFHNVERQRPDSQIRILFLARFNARKGIYETLEAVRRIMSGDSRVRLTMAGDGEEAPRIRKWCAEHGLLDRVSFPGYVTGVEKARILVDSDIFVLASYSEGCPNALLEAMGAGLPAVVTGVGGIPDIVCNGVNGLIVSPRSADDVESALRRLIGDPVLREAMARRNEEEASREYEASIVAARMETYYHDLAVDDAHRP